MRFEKARIAIVGDAIRDRWIFGRADRVSPEGPWLVHVEERIEERDGGAANVMQNCKALGATAELFALPRILWPIKTRYVAGNHQLFRADREKVEPIDAATEASILSRVQMFDPQVIVISDYAKGVCKPSLCQALIAMGKPVLVDPKGNDWRKYEGATMICPNEAEYALVRWPPTHYHSLLVTRGANGILLRIPDNIRGVVNTEIPAHSQEVFDVVGAGDTVVAALACCLAIGMELPEAARIANTAAGIAVSHPRTYAVPIDELEAAL